MRLKRILALALTLLLCCMGLTVYAEDKSATISTTVPGTHTITVEGEADVFCNGKLGTGFTVERLSQPKLLIRAVSGKEITQILLNDVDITGQVKGGYYTLEPIYEDKTLRIETKDAPPEQGKTYTVQGTVLREGKPVEGVTLELRSPLKTDKTGWTGTFKFTGVACGKRSLTAIENGEIVGYVEFTLAEGGAATLTYSGEDGTYTVTVNRSDAGIDLTLNLLDDGTMEIGEVTGVRGWWFYPDYGADQTPDSSTGTDSAEKSPQTGDSPALPLWLAGLLLAAAGMTACAYRRKTGCFRENR